MKQVRNRKANVTYERICVESRKMIQMNLFAKEIETDVENKRAHTKGRMNWEREMDTYTPLTL